MKLSTRWLKELVPFKGSVEDLARDLTMAGLEVEKIHTCEDGDAAFEIEITTNRPDWISHFGVAREISAIRRLALNLPETNLGSVASSSVKWQVKVEDESACPYYTANYIEGVVQNPTPDFIRSRLLTCGIRPISLIVDITNYVLLETGQPLHAFDADLIEGKSVCARFAKDKEKFKAIDGSQLELTADDLVIADQNKVIALAGVMGGLETEVTERTQNVLLEAAFFNPSNIRSGSKRHAIASDSSYRFERRVDPEGVDVARNRALALIIEYAKPKSISRFFFDGKKPTGKRSAIQITADQVKDVLGHEIHIHEIESILKSLGLDIKESKGDLLNVLAPSFRPDLTRSIDLIEEIARIYGYDKIPDSLPSGIVMHPKVNQEWETINRVQKTLVGWGLQETVTFSLISSEGLDEEMDLAQAVSIVNPQNRELCWMRPTLATSLLNVLRANLNFGCDALSIFEVANTYRQGDQKLGPEEDRVIAILLYGKWRPKNWLDIERDASFYDLKGIVELLLQSLHCNSLRYEKTTRSYLSASGTEKIVLGKKELGIIGTMCAAVTKRWGIEQPVFYAEISVPKILLAEKNSLTLRELDRFPSIQRDLAVMVAQNVKAGDIVQEILKMKEPLLKHVELFDFFEGGRVARGFKNLGYRLTYQSTEKTLVSEDIQALHTNIAEKITKKFEAKFQ